jgi:hypothetical protein
VRHGVAHQLADEQDRGLPVTAQLPLREHAASEASGLGGAAGVLREHRADQGDVEQLRGEQDLLPEQLRRHRLADEADRAAGTHDRAGLALRQGAEDDDGGRRGRLPHPRQGPEAVEQRHPQVQHDQVGLDLVHELGARLPVRGLTDDLHRPRRRRVAQRGARQLTVGRRVVHDHRADRIWSFTPRA